MKTVVDSPNRRPLAVTLGPVDVVFSLLLRNANDV